MLSDVTFQLGPVACHLQDHPVTKRNRGCGVITNADAEVLSKSVSEIFESSVFQSTMFPPLNSLYLFKRFYITTFSELYQVSWTERP